MDKLEVLKRSDIFHYLDEDDLKTIGDMATEETFKPGEIIFRQGEDSDKIYVIEEGLVSIIIELGPTDKRQVQAATNLECFGWSATIPPYRRVRTAKALEKTKVYSFNGMELRKLVHTNPRLCAAIAGGVAYVISQRLKMAFEQIIGFTYLC